MFILPCIPPLSRGFYLQGNLQHVKRASFCHADSCGMNLTNLIHIGIDFHIEGLKYILKGFLGDKLN